MLAGFYGGVELDFFAGGEAGLIFARGFERKHEGESFVGEKDSRWPQRIRFSSSPDHADFWF